MKSESCTITRKGQVTIPIRLRRAFRLNEGDRILFREENGKIIIEPVENHLEAALGLVKAKNPCRWPKWTRRLSSGRGVDICRYKYLGPDFS